MHCFNCKFEIKKSFAEYHLHNRNRRKILYQNEFEKFYPNLKLFYCEQCGIISIDHYAINKESLDIYYKEHYNEGYEGYNGRNTEYINAYGKARSDGQYNAISHYVNQSTVNNITATGYQKSVQVEVLDGHVVPEFGVIAGVILAVAIASIIAVSAKSRLALVPKY